MKEFVESNPLQYARRMPTAGPMSAYAVITFSLAIVFLFPFQALIARSAGTDRAYWFIMAAPVLIGFGMTFSAFYYLKQNSKLRGRRMVIAALILNVTSLCILLLLHALSFGS